MIPRKEEGKRAKEKCSTGGLIGSKEKGASRSGGGTGGSSAAESRARARFKDRLQKKNPHREKAKGRSKKVAVNLEKEDLKDAWAGTRRGRQRPGGMAKGKGKPLRDGNRLPFLKAPDVFLTKVEERRKRYCRKRVLLGRPVLAEYRERSQFDCCGGRKREKEGLPRQPAGATNAAVIEGEHRTQRERTTGGKRGYLR